MAVKVKALTTKVKYRGVFYLKGLYKMMLEYLKDTDYTTDDTLKYQEQHWYQREDPNVGKFMWIWWRVWKIEEGTTYYRMDIDIDYRFRFLKDVEVMFEGKKVKAQNTELDMMITGALTLDINNTWQDHWFLKHIHEFWYVRLWEGMKVSKENAVKEDVMRIQRVVKQFFELQHFMPLEGESFYPDHMFRV